MDPRARALDRAILSFIGRYAAARPPDGEFGALALRLFEHQVRHNPAYRKFCEGRGVRSGRVRDWRGIPAMPASGFRELKVAAFPASRARKVFWTSGTTAAARGRHFLDTLKLYEASLVPPFERALLPDGASCRFFILIAPPREAPHSSLSHMMGVVARRFSRAAARYSIRGGRSLFDALARDLGRERRPVMLLATAFSLKAFLDHLASHHRKLVLPRGSRLFETGGFKGRAAEVSKTRLYRMTARLLGIPSAWCVSEYGMTELSSQFYDAVAGRPATRRRSMRGPAWTRTLVIDPATGREAPHGRTGLLRHFDLANRGSVIAVDTEDLGRRAPGGGFELLGRVPASERRGCSLAYEELTAR